MIISEPAANLISRGPNEEPLGWRGGGWVGGLEIA